MAPQTANAPIEVRVPDIGDFNDVPVIEVLVKAGDRIAKEDSLITIESEKASMEVPSPAAGVVKDVTIAVGDRVSKGKTILYLEPESANPAASETAAPAPTVATAATATAVTADKEPEAQPEAPTSIEVTVPDMGDFKDVTVIDILVKSGDRVEKDASLVTIESEKASIDVPTSAAGVVRDVRVKLGDKISKGSVIVTLDADSPAEKPQAASAPATAPTPAASAPSQPKAVSAASPAPANAGGASVHASPSLRRLAREFGVDLGRVRASGPNGRVTRDDLQSFVKGALAGDGAASGFSVAAWPQIDFAQFGPIERKPLSRIKRLSGPALHRNWVTIPHVTQNDDADVTDLEEFRKELNAEEAKGGAKVTMLAFLMKAAVAALKEHPEFNASLDGTDLVLKGYYNIGFAADTPNGLLVPVLKDADKKGVIDIARETAELAAKARDGKLGPGDMQGGTFTISSLGSIGGTYFSPIINAPEVAILGACRASMKPVWDGQTFVPRLIQPLSLSYDHRVIDGAAAARFVVCIVRMLADIRRAIL